MSSQNNDKPEGFKMTELGLLPDEWKVVRLDNITMKTKQVDPRREPECKFKYVDVSGISREQLKITEFSEYLGKEAPLRARKVVKAGDIIFATVRPYLKRVAIVPDNLDGNRVSTAFCIIRGIQELAEPKYIFQAVTTDDFVKRVSERQRGSSYPAVTDKDILTQVIPLPSHSEQKAIARVLSTIQKAVEAQDKIITAARELKKSLMRHLFTYGPVPVSEAEKVLLKETEIGPVPEWWEVKCLVDTATLQRGKDLPKQNQIPGQYPIVGSSGIIGYHSEFVCSGPGVVTGRSGSIGNLAYVEENYWPHNTGLYVKDFHGNNPKFIYYLLHLIDFHKYATGVSVPTLNRNFVHPALVPVPSLPEQQEIARIFTTVDEKIEVEEKRKVSLQSLFKTMLHHLMTGKVRVKDMEATVL